MYSITNKISDVADEMRYTQNLIQTLMDALGSDKYSRDYAGAAYVALERLEGHVDKLRRICGNSPETEGAASAV